MLKFGGSSLATPERISEVARLVVDRVNGSSAAIVVSAFHGITNQLLECAHLAERRDLAYVAAFEAIGTRHRSAVDDLFGPTGAHGLRTRVNELLAELGDTLHGIHLLGHCPSASLDFVASFGERLSALIVAAHLNRFRPARFVDARKFVITDDQFTRANVHFVSTTRAARRYFAALWSDRDHPLAVVTGFIASTRDGRTTTIGRNGSDYTAAIVGAALRASAIEIWTDVDGVLSADPRTVRSAFVLPEITYEQAHEMSYFGAKVLHPDTIAPAVAASIPILIKNTFNPAAPGTVIGGVDERRARNATSISSMSDVILLTLKGTRIDAPPLAERLFRALTGANVDVLLTSQASCDRTITVAIANRDLVPANNAIAHEFRDEFTHGFAVLEEKTDQALLALIGDVAAKRRDVVCRVLGSLDGRGIAVNAVAESGTSRSIACVVDAPHRSRALNIIHRRLFDHRKLLALAIVGVGNVGSALLHQLAERQVHLSDQGFDVRVVGLANSRQFVTDPDGVDISRWREILESSNRPMDPSAFARELCELDLHAAAVIDCTAAEAVVDAYPDFVKANLHIITPNKRANVLPLSRYNALMHELRAHGKHFLYEANVGAGLPIISTIRDLIVSGDRIDRIEGICSGTLSYLFNMFDGTVAFSELVREAHRKGFTEPDPREDLSGLDVARKLLILARECGSTMELGDVGVEPLLPESLAGGSFSPAFFADLAAHDAEIGNRLLAARSRGSVLRYVGTFEHGTARARLEELPSNHPLAATKGADNSIAFTTKRYCDTPLVIQGPGAGAEVTAMGVFSDILKLARYLPD